MKVTIISPHPDDETLGAGGTLLKYKNDGAELSWIIVTEAREEYGYPGLDVKREAAIIDKVAAAYQFSDVVNLGLPPAALDSVPEKNFVQAIGKAINQFKSEILFVPFNSDVHSDHRRVFDASSACSKWFRYPTLKTLLAYETLSETEFNVNPNLLPFRPNCFSDISETLEKKLEIMSFFASEVASHPFPRSLDAIRALALLRGANAGFKAAEAFMLLKTLI